MRKLLHELILADAPSGREAEVRTIVVRELQSVTDKVEVDVLGNVMAWKRGTSDKRLMLIAHQDEDWSLMVKHIDDQGFLRFVRVVGHRWNLLGQRVTVHGKHGKRTGVIGLMSPHLIGVEQLEQGYQPRDDTMFIDCGANSRDDANSLGLEVGQFITAHKHFEELPNGRLLGNCLDDRVGLAIMIETMRRIRDWTPPMTIVAVASVQEELGTRGAQPAAFQVNPDLSIALDVAPTGDHPGIDQTRVPATLGKGPVLLHADQFHVTSTTLNEWFSDIAATQNLPLQHVALRTPIHFGTDAAAAQLAQSGAIVTAVLIPTRYFHTTNAIVDYADLEATVQLLVESFRRLNQLPVIP